MSPKRLILRWLRVHACGILPGSNNTNLNTLYQYMFLHPLRIYWVYYPISAPCLLRYVVEAVASLASFVVAAVSVGAVAGGVMAGLILVLLLLVLIVLLVMRRRKRYHHPPPPP